MEINKTNKKEVASPRADKADGESAVLATITAMPGSDRAMGERLHGRARLPTLNSLRTSPNPEQGTPIKTKGSRFRTKTVHLVEEGVSRLFPSSFEI